MNSNNKLISVKGRERPLSKKQKQVFLSLSKYEFDFSFLAPCPASGLIIHGENNKRVPKKEKIVMPA